MAVIVPPIKSQGIKTKLVPWINDIVARSGVDMKNATWIEPFFGTGVVGFNSPFKHFRVGDTNPHIINFYKGIQDGSINSYNMRAYLEQEGKSLSEAEEDGYVHYRTIRDRFNTEFSPFDFIFLSRAGFNGMVRFNRKGKWNVPFCKKPDRFAPAYVTKICNQVNKVSRIISSKDWTFDNVSFISTIEKAGPDDLIYCDPPYYGRYVDYYNGWTEEDERELFHALSRTNARFILSTWHHNDFRANDMIERYWGNFNIETTNHFYHSGANIENRHSMVEALVFNFDLQDTVEVEHELVEQDLFQAVLW